MQDIQKHPVVVTTPSQTLQPIPSASVNSFDVETFLLKLNAELRLARGLEIPDSDFTYFFGRLTADHYTEEQSKKAEIWILKGNWSFRGRDARVELADFWPDAKQCDIGDSVVIMCREEYAHRQTRWYQQGYNDRRVEDWQAMQGNHSVTLASAEQLKAQLRQIDDLEQTVSRQGRMIDEHNRSSALNWRVKYEQEQQERARVMNDLITLGQQVDYYKNEVQAERDAAKGVLRELFTDERMYKQKREEYLRHIATVRKQSRRQA